MRSWKISDWQVKYVVDWEKSIKDKPKCYRHIRERIDPFSVIKEIFGQTRIEGQYKMNKAVI